MVALPAALVPLSPMACVTMAWADAFHTLYVRRVRMHEECESYLAPAREAAARAVEAHARPPPTPEQAAAADAVRRTIAANAARAAAHAAEMAALDSLVEEQEEDRMDAIAARGRLDFFTRRHADGDASGGAVLEEAFLDERNVF